jgi:hypothetical protein
MLLLILHLKQPSRRPCPHCIASSKPTRHRRLGCRVDWWSACGWVSGMPGAVRPLTCGTRRWPCGSPPAPIPKRSACGRGTPRWCSPWTATASVPGSRCGAARPPGRHARRGPPGRSRRHGGGAARRPGAAPARPQRGPRRSRRTRRPGARPGLGWADGGAPPGTRTPNRCLKRATGTVSRPAAFRRQQPFTMPFSLPGLSVADPWMPSVCAPSVPHSLSVQQFLELLEIGGHGVPDTWHGDSPEQAARTAEF